MKKPKFYKCKECGKHLTKKDIWIKNPVIPKKDFTYKYVKLENPNTKNYYICKKCYREYLELEGIMKKENPDFKIGIAHTEIKNFKDK